METNKCPHCGYEYEDEYQPKPGGGSHRVAIKGDEEIKQIHLSNDVKMYMSATQPFGDDTKVGIFGCPKCKFVFWSETF